MQPLSAVLSESAIHAEIDGAPLEGVEQAAVRGQVVRPPELRVRDLEPLQRPAVRRDELRVFVAEARELVVVANGYRKGEAALLEAHATTFRMAANPRSMSRESFGGLM